MFDIAMELTAILQHDCHVDLRRINARRDYGTDLAAERDDGRVVNCPIAELLLAARAFG
jgi:hypothetical protein